MHACVSREFWYDIFSILKYIVFLVFATKAKYYLHYSMVFRYWKPKQHFLKETKKQNADPGDES